MEFTKPFIQTKTDVPPLTTFAIMQQHNKNIKEQQEKQQHQKNLQILMQQISFIREELELEENKKLSEIKNLSIDADQLTELIKVYLIIELFSNTSNWKYNVGPECMYSNPGMSTEVKEYIPCYKRHLHVPRLSIKKMEQAGVKLGKLVRGYRNFGKDTDGNSICEKYKIKDNKELNMDWKHFKNLMRKIGEIC
jgi:transcription antitermination factor NusG